jgi:uncharacterized membrane protein YczE
MTGLAAHTHRSIRFVRTAIEVVVLAAGWALGGQVGLGTLLYAASIGPLSQYFIQRLSLGEEIGRSGKPTSSVRKASARWEVPVEC